MQTVSNLSVVGVSWEFAALLEQVQQQSAMTLYNCVDASTSNSCLKSDLKQLENAVLKSKLQSD